MQFEKDNVLKFSQYMKSDKIPYIIYGDLESWLRKLMDVQTIWENYQQQKQENIFLADIQCQLYIELLII